MLHFNYIIHEGVETIDWLRLKTQHSVDACGWHPRLKPMISAVLAQVLSNGISSPVTTVNP